MLNKIKCLLELVMPPKMITLANTGNICLTRSHVPIHTHTYIMSQLVIISQQRYQSLVYNTTLYKKNMQNIV